MRIDAMVAAGKRLMVVSGVDYLAPMAPLIFSRCAADICIFIRTCMLLCASSPVMDAMVADGKRLMVVSRVEYLAPMAPLIFSRCATGLCMYTSPVCRCVHHQHLLQLMVAVVSGLRVECLGPAALGA